MTLLAVAVLGRGIVDPADPVLRADDEALLRGRAVFETVRVYGGRPFKLDEHLARLAASAERLGLPLVPEDDLLALADEAIAHSAVPESALRFYWTPAASGLALVNELLDYRELRARGQKLVSLPLGVAPDVRQQAPWLLGGVKSTSYAVNMAAEAEAKRRGADDAVFLAHGGVVLEGPTTNIWWRERSMLYTPSLDLGILAGVTRAVLLELSPYDVQQGWFTVEALGAADEIFTSSTLREVMPVSEIDGLPKELGEAAAVLQAALRHAATRNAA